MQNTLLACKNVLIVEDDDACRILVQLMLEDLGCTYRFSVNGLEAVSEVLDGKFDLVLMDLRMPVVDGFQATKAIREKHKDLPVIALTAHTKAWADGRCQESGINDCLAKPFRKEQLEAMLLKWTAGKE